MVDLIDLDPNKNGARIVLSPSPWKAAPFIFFALIFVLFGTLNISDLAAPNSLFSTLHFSWTALALFIAAAVFFGISVLVRTPIINVGPNEIKYITPFYKRSYTWGQVGPFFAISQHNHFKSNHYICAFTKEKHDLMVMTKQHQLPTIENADIVISLRSLPPGKDIKAAQGFAVMVNSCRDEFETPTTQDPKHAVRRTAWSK
ncbi:MAG: hypothetical protein V7750_08860 [Sneathiella sp.]